MMAQANLTHPAPPPVPVKSTQATPPATQKEPMGTERFMLRFALYVFLAFSLTGAVTESLTPRAHQDPAPIYVAWIVATISLAGLAASSRF
jgi:FtsH-binding integral membrane protein